MRITVAIIILNIVAFAAQVLFEPWFTEIFALTPTSALNGSWWQFFTYMFMHADPLHIFLNMFALFMFGVVMERALGWKKYLFLYIASGLGSAAFYILLTGISPTIMLGASGAVFGILAAFGFMFPKEVIYVYFIPLPAISAVFIFAAFELIAGITNIMPGIANFGHLGGIITSASVMFIWKHTSKPRNERELRDYRFYWE
ncbi:MAG: rhomboid family intramembrane serine protease [Candidatus Aenigmatarchaeota archaeon]